MSEKDKPSLRLEWIPAADLKANPNNWRRHPELQRDALDALLFGADAVGWAGAALYNEATGRLIDGHLRREVGIIHDEPIPVLIGSWTEEEEKRILATLDPIAAMAEANREKLGSLLQSVQSDEAAVQAILSELAEREGVVFGGNGQPPEDPGLQVDRAEELQEVWQVERGQVWEIPSQSVPSKAHRVMCGDSTGAEDVGRLIMEDKGLMLATDPPFSITGSATGSQDMSGLEIIRPFFRLWMKIWFEYLPTFSHIYVCCDWRTYSLVDTEGSRHGAIPKNCIVWKKTTGGLGSFYQNGHEFIWFGVRQPPRRIKKNLTGHRLVNGKSNIWELTPVTYKAEVFHTANKPVGLFSRAIKNSSDVESIVLEPFLGAGSCIEACEQTARIGYGMEIEPKYVAVTLERLTGLGLDPQRID